MNAPTAQKVCSKQLNYAFNIAMQLKKMLKVSLVALYN